MIIQLRFSTELPLVLFVFIFSFGFRVLGVLVGLFAFLLGFRVTVDADCYSLALLVVINLVNVLVLLDFRIRLPEAQLFLFVTLPPRVFSIEFVSCNSHPSEPGGGTSRTSANRISVCPALY